MRDIKLQEVAENKGYYMNTASYYGTSTDSGDRPQVLRVSEQQLKKQRTYVSKERCILLWW
jgi:hypothetical protein